MPYTIKDFPSTRYQGSKRKIVPWIASVIGELTHELPIHTALDAFGGTGTVGYLLKKMGLAVTYNDKLTFNYIIGKALIENSHQNLIEEDLIYLKNRHEQEYPSFIQNTFGGQYYTEDENIWLDTVVHNINNMNHYRHDVLETKKAMAFYSLFQACLIKRPYNLFHRANLDMRFADVERNFGNKASWDKSFDIHFLKFATELNSFVFDSEVECNALNQPVLEVEGEYDLVYLDPPYLNIEGTNETANYLKMYHFLEGIANYQTWPNLVDFTTANNRLLGVSTIDDFNRKNIYKTFDEIVDKFRDSTIVLSYKRGGLPSESFLIKLMKKHKRTVVTKTKKYSYALNRQNGSAKGNREMLIIGI